MNSSKLHILLLYILFFALALCFFIRVEPSIVWGTDTFIGVCVAMMAITMAIIIGYQAISAHDIKTDLKEQQEENRTLREQVSDNQQTLRQQQETFENAIRQEIAIVNSKTNIVLNN